MIRIKNEGGGNSGLIESEVRKRRFIDLLMTGKQLLKAMTESSVKLQIAPQRLDREMIFDPIDKKISFKI